MSAVLRIRAADGTTVGWQARVHVVANRYVSRYFACAAHGGSRKARRLADAEVPKLERLARKRRRIARAEGPRGRRINGRLPLSTETNGASCWPQHQQQPME